MENDSSSLGVGAALGRWWGQSPQPSPSTDVMNQLCRVCAEPAAGFHFGAFTCEGCKSFFGRTYNNLGSITECKNNGECVINKKNRTACKACRLKKCLLVGMSKSGSRYGRRSNWFKIHCLLQEQQQAGAHLKDKSAMALWRESYKNLAVPPQFESDSKGSPTEESITLNNNNSNNNNNNLSKERERSPNAVLPSYSAEAAAALWAARHSLFPMQLPHHPIPSIPMSFMPPFGNFPSPGNAQSQRNILLPFIQNLHSSPSSQSNHQSLTVSSRSSEGSVCSQPPSPIRNHQSNSSRGSNHFPERASSERRPSPVEKSSTVNSRPEKNSISEKGSDNNPDGGIGSSNRKIAEEHSLAILRSLGPVQEKPMDLSVRVAQTKSQGKVKVSLRSKSESDDRSDECSDAGDEGDEGDEGDRSDRGERKFEVSTDPAMESKDENFNRRKNPLDLTKPPKLAI